MSYRIEDEPRKLAGVLRAMVECGPAPADLWQAEQPDGDPFVMRAAELLEEQETQLEMLTRLVDSLGAQLQPLTDEEISSIWEGHIVPVFGKNGINPVVFARAIERAHGIGEQDGQK